jgi:hypothetical protein
LEVGRIRAEEGGRRKEEGGRRKGMYPLRFAESL